MLADRMIKKAPKHEVPHPFIRKANIPVTNAYISFPGILKGVVPGQESKKKV